MKRQLEEILDGKRLSTEEARLLMRAALDEGTPPAQLAALLTAFRARAVTADELDGFAQALLELAAPADLSPHEVIDLCGTGGDGRGSFNISTTAAFVLAGAGCKVAKHGNYAASSSCGSSNVLEALGVRFVTERDRLLKSLEESSVCFLHAPLFHPALKRAAPVRRELGFATVFNMLGPLVNPARPSFQMAGVFSRGLLRLYSAVLSRRSGSFAALISADGYDEVTLTAPVHLATRQGTRELLPEDFGLPPVQPEEIRAGKTVEESAEIVRAVLEGRGTRAQEDVVVANAGLALFCRSEGGSLKERVAEARESIRSGRAAAALQASVAASRE